MASRQCPSPTFRSMNSPRPSGPRCASASVIPSSAARSTGSPVRCTMPAMPHMQREYQTPSAIDLEEVPCMVCSSGDAIVREPALRDYEYGVPGLFTLRECRACGQHYLSPRPKESDLPQCYPLDYHGYQTRAISRLYDFLTAAQMHRRFARYH